MPGERSAYENQLISARYDEDRPARRGHERGYVTRVAGEDPVSGRADSHDACVHHVRHTGLMLVSNAPMNPCAGSTAASTWRNGNAARAGLESVRQVISGSAATAVCARFCLQARARAISSPALARC